MDKEIYPTFACLSRQNISFVLPKRKCPHERGKDLNEPEAVTMVSSCWVGRKWKNYFRGGRSENRGLLPASKVRLRGLYSCCFLRRGDNVQDIVDRNNIHDIVDSKNPKLRYHDARELQKRFGLSIGVY